jgi:hypothetical protein
VPTYAIAIPSDGYRLWAQTLAERSQLRTDIQSLPPARPPSLIPSIASISTATHTLMLELSRELARLHRLAASLLSLNTTAISAHALHSVHSARRRLALVHSHIVALEHDRARRNADALRLIRAKVGEMWADTSHRVRSGRGESAAAAVADSVARTSQALKDYLEAPRHAVREAREASSRFVRQVRTFKRERGRAGKRFEPHEMAHMKRWWKARRSRFDKVFEAVFHVSRRRRRGVGQVSWHSKT